MHEDINKQIAIAASKTRKKYGYAPEGPLETERLEKELTSMALTALVTGGVLVGAVGILTLLAGMMNSGGVSHFFSYFISALLGN